MGGRYFVDSSHIFSSISSVCNFDIPGNTIYSNLKALSSIPLRLVHRQLDDVPLVGRANTTWCQDFSSLYKRICKEVDAELALGCPMKEKAFTNSTKGKVLGIVFDTSSLSWDLPVDKKIDYSNLIHHLLSSKSMSIEDGQSLLGKLNFVCSMAPALKSFKFLLQVFLSSLHDSGQTSLPIPSFRFQVLIMLLHLVSS